MFLAGCSERDVEEQLGTEAAAAIESTYEVNSDPLLTGFVSQAGQTMVGHAPRQGLPYEFDVINSDLVNAFAAPYGHIYVTRGLLEFAASEDEVWTVLGHEIGHVARRDAMKSLKETLLWQVGLMLLARNGGSALDAGRLGFFFVSMRHSRRDELQADDEGVDLTYAAGYDPRASLAFLDRLATQIEKERPSKWEVYFRTHPDTASRITRQQQRPPLADADAGTWSRIGRGYASRGMYAPAQEALSRAVAGAPSSTAVRLALGQCYAARGDVDRARAEFQQALAEAPQDGAAQRGLALLDQPANSGPAAPAEVVGAAVQRAEALAGDLQAASAALTALSPEMDAKLQPTQATVRSSVDSLLALQESPGLGGPGSLALAAAAQHASGQASEVVFRLESLQSSLADTARRLTTARDGAARVLALAPPAETVTHIEDALDEVAAAAAGLRVLAASAPQTTKAASDAADVAQNTLRLVARALTAPPDAASREVAQDAVAATAGRAKAAREEVERVAAEADLARTRALVAQMDVAAALADPDLRPVFDQVVGHFTQAEAVGVQALMARTHAGYGEAALLLATALATGTATDDLEARAATEGVAEAAQAADAPLRDVNIVLTYLANALQAEADLVREAVPDAKTAADAP